MRTSLKVLGILTVMCAVAMCNATAQAGGGRFGGGGGRGPQFRGRTDTGPQAAPVSIPDQFFGQTTARQDAFFSQSVFPQSNFVVTPMFQPGIGGTYVSPPMSNILPPLFVTGYQPGFYVAPTTYSVGGAYIPVATVVYSSPQPLNSYYSGRSSFNQTPIGMIGRW